MGNILKYQNPSSPLLNTSYKKYEGEDLSDIETFNKNWLKYRDSQLAKQGWLDESIKNKLTWLQRNFGTSDKTVGNLVREQLFSNLDNTRELSFSDAVKDSQGRYLLTESMYSDFPKERELYEVEIGPPKPVDDWKLDYAFNGSVKGTHYPDFNTIIYGDKYQHTPVKIHERDHAMFGQYGNDNIGLKIVENIFKQEFLDNVSDKWGYYDDPGEIRARLMEMRFNNKLDPTHKYTLEEIENMRNDPNFKDDHIFNRYTNKYIEYLLNTVAQNITDPNRIDYRDPVTIAKKGSKIHIKKKNRGKFTAAAKRAGMGTQEYARHILANKDDYSPIQVKRAAFAKGIGGSQIKKHKHENGGIIKAQDSAKLITRVNSSNAEFPKRLQDPNRDVIKDWADSTKVANFKLGWATDENGTIVYPMVQNINGKLIDFERPPYHPWAGYDSAIERQDTVRMSPENAKWFTENYKKYYSGF